jgi:hypothetical protein
VEASFATWRKCTKSNAYSTADPLVPRTLRRIKVIRIFLPPRLMPPGRGAARRLVTFRKQGKLVQVYVYANSILEFGRARIATPTRAAVEEICQP